MKKKIMIDKTGKLQITRPTIFKHLTCPFNPNGTTICGDWCSLFHEPRNIFPKHIELKLCNTSYVFKKSQFEDQR